MTVDRQKALKRKQRVFEILDEALERPSKDRLTFLGEACGDDPLLRREVEDLLETEGDEGLLAQPAFSVHANDPSIGRRIDSYKLVRLLDRGGMGSVYLAEREDFEQRVALKLIRRGLDLDEVLVRRFHNERQILARLEHPHIARLLDGGTTSDLLPYFVMEYVEGEPIDRYCENRGLSVDARLKLFRKVCSAVQFAHQNLVVHRDLKPGNILISADGEPKLLDFGIAKLLDQELAAQTVATELGQGPMTPRYASPEQIRLKPITTASDVYSLGVLLYELLTGLDPYDVDTGRSDEIARAICEREPTRPSTAVRRRAEEHSARSTLDPRRLGQRLSGDLDSIVLKAMRKEPHERYASVEQFSEDIRRHLTGLPVAARTGTFTYRAGKFVRRHRLALTMTAAFLILILTSSILSTILWRQADHEKERAKTAFGLLRKVIKSTDPNKDAKLELLESAKKTVAEALKDEPELQIDVVGILGEAFLKQGAFEEAEELMRTSLRIAQKYYGEVHPEVAKRLNNWAVLLHRRNKFVEAEEYLREALAIRLRLGQEASNSFRSKINLAAALMFQGEYEKAERLYVEVLNARIGLYLPVFGSDDEDVAQSRHHLGAFYYDLGDFEKAEPELSRALASYRRRHDWDHTAVASVLDLQGSVLAGQGEQEEAERRYLKALGIRSRLLGEDHSAVASTRKNLAALQAGRDPVTARVFLDKALRTFKQTHPDGWEAAEAKSILGAILVGEGRYEEAEPLLVEGYERLAKIRSRRSIRTRTALGRLIELYKAWDKAEKLADYQDLADSGTTKQQRSSRDPGYS